MRPSHLFLLAACAAVCLAVPVRADVVAVDPTGDMFGPGVNDITGVTVTNSGGGFTIRVSYAGTISAPSLFAVDSLAGFIDLDTDQNAATGGTAPWGAAVPGGNNWINHFISPAGGSVIPSPYDTTISLGDEYYLDIGSESLNPGLVNIVRTSDSTTVGTGSITFASSFFDVFVSLSDIGGDDGSFNLGVVTGTVDGPTDRAPNGATPIVNNVDPTAIPEPASVLLLGLGAGCLWGYRRRRSA